MTKKRRIIQCAWCQQKARWPDNNVWRDIRSIKQNELDKAEISHGICPTCYRQNFGELLSKNG